MAGVLTRGLILAAAEEGIEGAISGGGAGQEEGAGGGHGEALDRRDGWDEEGGEECGSGHEHVEAPEGVGHVLGHGNFSQCRRV